MYLYSPPYVTRGNRMKKHEITDISIIGAGTMGYSIALDFAIGGQRVRLFDIDDQVLQAAEDQIQVGLDGLIETDHVSPTQRESILERIRFEDEFKTAVNDADLVTEAVPEDIEVKYEVFEELDKYAPATAIIASNTSGLSITDIASTIEDPSRVLGTHYFNPAYIIPVVEVVAGAETSDEIMQRTTSLLESVGKTPVTVNKDIPGFIVNRIQTAMVYEAESLVERGIASPQDIDRAVRGSFGLRMPVMGLFEIADVEGLDVHVEVLSYLMKELDRGSEPAEFLQELVDNGKLGLKTGEGIYDWPADQTAVLEKRDKALLKQQSVYNQCDHLKE